MLVRLCLSISFYNRPGQSNEYHEVADEDENEGDEEDLAVELDMINVEPLIRCEPNQQHFC